MLSRTFGLRPGAVLLAVALLLGAAAPLAADSYPGDAYGSSSSSSSSYLGIDTRDVTADRVAPLKLKEERGVEVTMVDQDAPAGKAGLKEHDVILTFNGQPVESVEELRRMIRETPAGRTVSLGVSRDGEMKTLQATLADRRKVMSWAWSAATAPEVPEPPEPPEPQPAPFAMPAIEVPSYDIWHTSTSRAGLLVENLTPQLAEFFGAKNGEGVLVRSVEKGSAAASAGFKAGDVIVRVDKDRINDISDWRSSMRQHRGGKVPISVLRDKKEQTITLAVPSRERGAFTDFDFDMPDIEVDGIQLERQMKLLKPEIERSTSAAMALASTKVNAQMVELRRQLAQATRQAQREMERHRLELERASREAARRAREAQKKQHSEDPTDDDE